MSEQIILAIESSCDETAAAVIKNGREVLSNVVSTQIAIHQKFGGVVPEVASRKHMEYINIVISEALEQAQLSLQDINCGGSDLRSRIGRLFTGGGGGSESVGVRCGQALNRCAPY